jgi:hypothetical protein
MNKRIPLFVLLFLLSFSAIFAQKEIKGRVLDQQTREPVANAAVTMHPVGSTSIISYSMTSKEGTFTLRSANMPDSVEISVKAMTLESQTKHVKSDIGFVEFLVVEKTMELKEVIVQAPKIRQLGDTIHHDVASFLDETDRSIGDVLKKLPGIQVLSSGQILYQNKAISKFYVEGLDLLKGKYGIATNNVDATKVASVQVLENHQPIKALKDMEIPEAAAINLKLKKSAHGAFFLTAQAGAGLPPMLLSNELVGMRFSATQQDMSVYKGDNTGRDIVRELTSFYGGSGGGPVNFMSVIAPVPPAIREQHHLFNNAHLGSLNSLKALKKDLTLTGNLNYLYDQQKSSSYSKRDIFVADGGNIHITEDMNAQLLKRELEGTLTLEGNTDEYFLNNKLNVSSRWNEHTGKIAAVRDISQFLQFPSFNIGNDFEYLRRKENKNFRVGSQISYTMQNHSLSVSPVLFDEVFTNLKESDTLIRQEVSYNHLKTNLYVSGGNLGKRFTVGYSTNVFSDHYFMQSGLFVSDAISSVSADTLRNRLHRNEIGIRLNGSLSYRFSENFKPILSFPVSYLFINRNDHIRNTSKNGGHVLISPLLIIQYPISSRWDLFSNVRFSNQFGGINEDYLGYIMANYRGMNRSNGLLGKNHQTGTFVHFSYKNPFTTLFTSFRLSYSNIWRNTLGDVRYNGIMSSSTSIPYTNTSHYYGLDYSFGQSIDAIKSEMKLFASYNKSKTLSLNQGIVSNLNFDSYSLSPSITTDIGRFMVLKYDISYRHTRSKIRNQSMPAVHNVAQNLGTSIIPVKKLIFNISFNHYFNSLIESEARSSWFGNLGVKYKLKNVDLMLDWTNIFNTNKFITYSYSDISSYYSVYMLRPSEILLRIRFKIL